MSFTESLTDLVAENRTGLLSRHPSWQRVRLGDACEVQNGAPFESKKFSSNGVGTPLIRIRDVLRGYTETSYVGDVPSEFMVQRGDLVVGMDGDFAARQWAGRPALLNQRVCRITPVHRGLLREFVAYALPGYLAEINAKTSAITVKHLSSRTVEDIPLPLPSTGEQHRIVSVLDSYFSRLDAAEAALQRVEANLKRYRASVLKAAVEGRLVPTEAELARQEGRDYEPASVLLERILVERRRKWEAAELAKMVAKGKPPTNDKWKAKYKEPTPPDTEGLPELPEGWCWATVDALGEVQGGISKGKRRAPGMTLHDVPYLRVANVQRGYLNLGVMKTIAVTDDELEQLRLEIGDVLFNEGGDRDKLGRGWVWSGELKVCIHQNHVFRVRPDQRAIEPRFLSWYGNSGGQRYFLEQGRQTTNLASINKSKLSALPVPVPPRAEQRRIASKTDEWLTTCDYAAEGLRETRSRLARLRQSILKWAFEGRLVDQDPTDEPASVLLERIRAEREAADAKPKAKRATRKRKAKS